MCRSRVYMPCICICELTVIRDVGRTLTNGGYNDVLNMTAANCINYCATQGNTYAGTEYGQECCKIILFLFRIFGTEPSYRLWYEH